MGNRLQLLGKKFGQLVVTKDMGDGVRSRSEWQCRCSCGKYTVVAGYRLTSGHTTSCRCRQGRFVHGLARTKRINGVTREYKLWNGARGNGKQKGWNCTLKVSDIHIPKTCPVLGITLNKNAALFSDNLPSLDRIDNRRKYTPDNIWAISYKANKLKGHATLGELKLLVSALTKVTKRRHS